MQSAPASIPASTHDTFAAAFADATPTASRCSCQPAASANRRTGTSRAADTKFGSSKTGRIM